MGCQFAHGATLVSLSTGSRWLLFSRSTWIQDNNKRDSKTTWISKQKGTMRVGGKELTFLF